MWGRGDEDGWFGKGEIVVMVYVDEGLGEFEEVVVVDECGWFGLWVRRVSGICLDRGWG